MNIVKALRLMLVAAAMMAGVLAIGAPAEAQVAFEFRVGFAPPELPVYDQPICPREGYIWTPGYWAWDGDDGDYYWVPGTWVLAPEPGYLWTPGYWGWYDSAYVFYPGYWGPVVGFYGGINYGFGYFGRGYEGGRWEGGRFYYNRTVNNINVTEIHNVYNTTVVNRNETRVSFNGGAGGMNARPTAEEQAAARERHIGPVAAQQQHINAARGDRSLRASENHGRPPIAATPRPASFSAGTVAARSGGNYNPPPNRGRNAGGNAHTDRPPSARNDNGGNRPTYSHPNELPKTNRPEPPPSSGNPKADQKYQRQQEQLYQKQEQEHQRLQQRQDQEHQKAVQKQANEAQKQQMEQRHQQQTQQMEQRHSQQQQQVQRQAPQPRQQPPHGGGEPHEPHH